MSPDPQPIPAPSELFGPLFEQVQRERLFVDSKTFPDLVPLESPNFILEHFERTGPLGREELRRFVEKHFSPLTVNPSSNDQQGQDLAGKIQGLWTTFVRQPVPQPLHGSLIQTGHAYIVPGGRFGEAYYWDSYFSSLGLVAEGRTVDAEDIFQGFAALIDRFGYVPNGTRSYYLGRSQPPLFYLMADLAGVARTDQRCLALLIKEHAFWMSGALSLGSGEAYRRVVKLADGSVLNRYWDDVARPRDEAYAEDLALANRSDRPSGELYCDVRAAAESGWDFCSRWLNDPTDLATICTTAIVPIDLNSFLWGLETDIYNRLTAVGETALARDYRDMADRRAQAIRDWLWDPKAEIFCDYDWMRGVPKLEPTAALLTPLFVGLARPSEAVSAARVIERRFLRAGGLVTTEITSGQQWDAPNGWAPLQWIGIMGLARFGHSVLAETIANRWLAMVEDVFNQTGQLFEKYDVETFTAGGGGEYAPQNGFGWTNGVTRALMAWRASGYPAKPSWRLEMAIAPAPPDASS